MCSLFSVSLCVKPQRALLLGIQQFNVWWDFFVCQAPEAIGTCRRREKMCSLYNVSLFLSVRPQRLIVAWGHNKKYAACSTFLCVSLCIRPQGAALLRAQLCRYWMPCLEYNIHQVQNLFVSLILVHVIFAKPKITGCMHAHTHTHTLPTEHLC